MSCGGGCSGSTGVKLDEKTKKHPCYNPGAHENARMHIPVAPKCNIQCNYCNRKYDCVNETRPGVTSEVLSPVEARDKYKFVKEKVENLTVVGIAGPGDALANWEETKESVKLIQEEDKDVIICLSTNGLMLDKYKEEIVELGINHVTITINSINPEIGAKIYEFVNYEGEILTGIEAAEKLQENQLAGLKYLADSGVLVKVNIVMVKGVNNKHIPEVVKEVKSLGALMTNIMPLIPAKGTRFEDKPLVSKKELNEIRKACSIDLRQMYHCQQCRADAIGKLTQDRSLEFRKITAKESTEKVRFAVASKEGQIIDQHFGHVEAFYIYEFESGKVNFIEKREVEKYCGGIEDCDTTASKIEKVLKVISDCQKVLCVRIGYSPKTELKKNGIESVETYDRIEDGIKKAVNAY